MTVNRVTYLDWRNIGTCDITLCSGINVLWGMNAQGKSNILEGIYYFARGRSFRGAKDRELVRFGSDFAKATIDFRREGYNHDTRLEAILTSAGKKKLTKNGAPLSSSEMIGSFCAVLFSPANLSIVTGGPGERRSFLDIAISQLSGSYLLYLKKYTKFLAERNALLKLAASGENVSENEWEVYARGLAECGAYISAYRRDYAELVAEAVTKYFAGMTDGAEVPSIIYNSHSAYEGMPRLLSSPEKSTVPDCSALYEKLMSNIPREIAAGSTLWGIHKDDLSLSLNEKEAKLYASQGQQRCIALSLKLAEAEIANLIRGEFPVILLDDVFSELDENRRRYILESLGKNEQKKQIIITSCEPDVIPSSFGKFGVTFRRVENGSVTDGE